MRRRFVSILLLCLPALPAAARRASPIELPLRIRVARCGGKPVRAQAWVRQHVEATQRVFAPFSVKLRPRIDTFVPASCRALDSRARHALARHVPPDGVTVLVVELVRDLDLPSYNLAGVHWRYRGSDPALQGRRYVLLTARAKPPVLAHELAHYFGLPHDPEGGNLMTPGPSAPVWRDPTAAKPKPFAPELTAAQGRRLRLGIEKQLDR